MDRKKTMRIWAIAVSVAAGATSLPARSDELQILSWSTDSKGLIQTYTENGKKNGDPISPPVIPEGGLHAIQLTAIPLLYRVEVGHTVLYVADPSIKKSVSRFDPSSVCSNSSKSDGKNTHEVNGVAEKCR